MDAGRRRAGDEVGRWGRYPRINSESQTRFESGSRQPVVAPSHPLARVLRSPPGASAVTLQSQRVHPWVAAFQILAQIYVLAMKKRDLCAHAPALTTPVGLRTSRSFRDGNDAPSEGAS